MPSADMTCPRCGSKNVTAHCDPHLPTCEADIYAPVREEGYMCHDCKLLESCLNHAPEHTEFCKRWNDWHPMSPEERRAINEHIARSQAEEDRAWMWPDESQYPIGNPASRAADLAEQRATETFICCIDNEIRYVPVIPIDDDRMQRVIAHPDDPAPRWDYARWLRTIDHPIALRFAEFIEWQLKLAESFARDPHIDFRTQLPEHVFFRRTPERTDVAGLSWWRIAREAAVHGSTPMVVLQRNGLIDDTGDYRGFTEHVAMRAERFLELADEVYAAAPIRQLTLTYCKGKDHTDRGLFEALLASPHLDRIRALKLPVRKFRWDRGNNVTVLNRLDDDDLARLAASPHLRKLSCLDLEDQKALTIRGFDALAASPNLPMLSAVRYDLHHYWHPGTFSFGTSGKESRALGARPLAAWAAELEARHGYLPWLHPVEHYGTEDFDVEAPIEHPIARERRSI